MENQGKHLVFKDYSPNQQMLLPPSLDELIASNHPVRVVSEVVDKINIDVLLQHYKPGGASVYHPRMLLKVLIYGYLSNIYSSRKMESALQENIHFMWLSAMNRPDHNTIARFRSERLKDSLKEIFAQVVELLVEEGLVSIKEIYTDGTKIEANANKYSFVWGRAIKSSRARIGRQLEELWAYTQQLAEEELAEEKAIDFTSVDREKVEQTIAKIDKALTGKEVDKKVRQKLGYAKKNWPNKLDEYDQKEQAMGERNSYSKTDPDATFMRMKEDHMLNGQLKPGYNLQISSSDQYVVNYSLHQNPTDTLTLKPHLQQFNELYNQQPDCLCADSGYGSEENYEYLEDHKITSYVKYNYFHKEQSKKWKNDPFRSNNLHYDEDKDELTCPSGQPMDRIEDGQRITASGFKQQYARYQARDCQRCPLRSDCHNQKQNRIVKVNHKLRRYKQISATNLESKEGKRHRAKRPWDVETVFASFKHNRKFRRFNLRGLEKVEIEAGLLAIAHNLAKKAA